MKTCPKCGRRYEDAVAFCPEDGEVLDIDHTALVGTTLDGQYHIEKMLGHGGMGAVYLARHLKLGDFVAIKILPASLRGNPEYQRRFVREAKAARQFRHPNVVEVHDLRETDDGMLYMVQEYVSGTTLADELSRCGRMSPRRAFHLLRPVFDALETAHAAGVVHRDLKPENIMLGTDKTGTPVVKVLDLGIAKLTRGRESTAMTIDGQMLGTPFYMSPEQWEGRLDIDGRTDIYSLGVVLYELVAGKRPFEARTLEALAAAHAFKSVVPLHKVVRAVPVAFSQVVSAALAKDPSHRPQTMAEFATALEASLPATEVADTDLAATLLFDTEDGLAATAPEDGPVTILDGRDIPTNPLTLAGITSDETLAFDSAKKSAVVPVVEPTKPVSAVVTEALEDNVASSVAIRGPKRWLWLAALAAVLVGGAVAYRAFFAPAPVQPVVSRPQPEFIDVLGYWIEAETSAGKRERLVESPALASGRAFKIVFTPSRSGYVYMIGTGSTANAPRVFLSSVAAPGIPSNAVSAETMVAVPADTPRTENWFTLDKTPGIERYSLIFSPTPLVDLAAFDRAPGSPLTQAEHLAWERFRKERCLWLRERASVDRQRMLLAAPRDANQPLAFDIVLTHTP